jgi:hypothetical protein
VAQGQSFAETGVVEASDGELGDGYAYALDVSGSTLVVGAWADTHLGTNSGSAYVYERDLGGAGNWGEAVKLAPSDGAAGDSFGLSVAVDGDRVVVGAVNASGFGADSGAAYVFERNAGGAGAWGQVAKLNSSAGVDSVSFGYAVATAGDTVVVGDPGAFTYPQGWPEATGASYLFERDQGGAGAWGQTTELKASDALDGAYYGSSVTLAGDTAVVGAELAGAVGINQAGAAYVYERDAGGANAWGEVTALSASDAALGEQFGHSVAVDGDLLVVGANRDDASGFQSGSAYVFERNQGGAGSWGEVTKLTPSDGAAWAYFGESVAMSGGTALVGAWGAESLSGAVYVFGRDHGGTGAWGEVQKLSASAGTNGNFGYAVALDGDTAAGGAIGAAPYGAGHVFTSLPGGSAYCTAGSSANGCQASLSAAGTASATAPSGFVLQATSVEGAKSGLFYYGTNGRQAGPWGTSSSLQCVVPPVIRAGLLVGGGSVGACDGSFVQDLNALWASNPAKNPGAGASVQAQLWYRDPLNPVNSKKTSLSDGYEFTVAP